MRKRWCLFTFIIVNFLVITYATDYLKTTKLECTASPKYIYNHSCRLKPVNRYKATAFMQAQIRNYLRNISVNIGIYVRNDANAFKPFLVNFTANVCDFMDKKVSGLYLNLFMKVLTKYSNANHSCPYEGVVKVENLYMDTSLLPVVAVPKYVYRVLFLFYEGYPYDYVGTVAAYLEVIESKN